MLSSAQWRSIVVTGLLLCGGSANAIWYEAQGTAPIIDGNIDKARERATAEALRNAAIYAGVSIQSYQSVSHGVLTEDQWNFKSSADIRATQVIAEKRSTDDQFTVSIRADIFPESHCSNSQFGHKVTVTRFPLAHRQQATYGGLYELGGAVSKVLHGKFQQAGGALQSHLWLDEVFNYPVTQLTPSPQVEELARSLARKTDSQYVLLGQIRDISVSQQEDSSWLFWQESKPPRALALEVDLIDGISGDLIERFNYQDQVHWNFGPTVQVDPYSADFWRSNYGLSWGYLLDHVQRDVESALACQPSIAHIIHLQDQAIVVNMGEQDGVQLGHKARLSRLGTFMDSFGRVRTSLQPAAIEMTVSAVHARQAVLQVKEPSEMAGVQLNDVVLFVAEGS